MLFRKLPASQISMADILAYAQNGDHVVSSRMHVGSTTASLGYFAATGRSGILSFIGDTTFHDGDYSPHCLISTEGTQTIGNSSVISYLSKVTTPMPARDIKIGQSISDLHVGKLQSVFPESKLEKLSDMLRKNRELVIQVIEMAWEYISTHDTHRFRLYVCDDGVVEPRPSPENMSEVLDDLALITGDSGWKIPNIIVITLDMLLGSKADSNYYHLCGPAMCSYIEKNEYPELIQKILGKMMRFGRYMYLVNLSPFKVFCLTHDRDLLDEKWRLWKKYKQEPHLKHKGKLEQKLIELIRSRKLPWYGGCDGKAELTQHDLGIGIDDLYVPSWSLYANFEELSEFAGFTVKYWKSQKEKK